VLDYQEPRERLESTQGLVETHNAIHSRGDVSNLRGCVLRVLESTPRKSENDFFWSGVGKQESIVRSWQTRLRRLFELAGIVKGHAHRFRNTFAVELLLAGIPIERVSILLGHQSTRVTEKHYNTWVRSRQEQLEADLERAWSRDPLLPVEAKVTRQLRGERARVN